MKALMFKFQNVIPNRHLVIELLDVILKSSLMQFNGIIFNSFFGIIMGTNAAPILANLYLAMLEKELEAICKAKTIKCQILRGL